MSNATANDEVVLRRLSAQQTQAWNRGDAKAFSSAYIEDAKFIAGPGAYLENRVAIEDTHNMLFSTVYRGSSDIATIESLTFPVPGVAVIDVFHEIRNYAGLPGGVIPTSPGVLNSRLRTVAIKQAGEWRFASAQNTYVLPKTLMHKLWDWWQRRFKPAQ